MIYVVTRCSYAALGVLQLFSSSSIRSRIKIVRRIADISIPENKLHVLLIVDLSNLQSVVDLRYSLNRLRSYKGKKQIGVVVSQCNLHVSKIVFTWLRGKCVFFMPKNGKLIEFTQQIVSWSKGRTRGAMPVIYSCEDTKYHLTLHELSVLVFSVAGEKAQSLAEILGVPLRSIYYIRDAGARKLGVRSYKEFRSAYISGRVRLEFERVVAICGRQIVIKN